jgi:hypothetical protein
MFYTAYCKSKIHVFLQITETNMDHGLKNCIV